MWQATNTCMRKYTDFSGRAPRAEFWKFMLALFLISVVLIFVNAIIFGPEAEYRFVMRSNSNGISQSVVVSHFYNGGWLETTFNVAVFLPTLAVTWRRLHDIGRPGWHAIVPIAATSAAFAAVMYFSLIEVPVDQSLAPPGVQLPATISIPKFEPVTLLMFGALAAIAWIMTIVWLAKRSYPGPNKYGPNPRKVTP